MNNKEHELNLLKNTLAWAYTQPKAIPYLEYYTDFYNKASVHVPITSEDWGKDNIRVGPATIRETTCELVTTVGLAINDYEIQQVTNKKEINYGSDLKASKGALDYVFSIKPAKLQYIDDNHSRPALTLLKEYFSAAEWRVAFLCLVHPESRQIWLINYPLLGNMYCTRSERGLFTPTFKGQSVRLDVTELQMDYPRGIQYLHMSEDF